ncbi:unnamed protein product [Gongylonema pulchrum]|uniref:Uncharacterized protein n=1 Tax=Gongylonema pulchrum TaxID=637853 RepID=A0A183DKC6_9BILA|nr:unnamed protein product [Gongylonema pulchrum]
MYVTGAMFYNFYTFESDLSKTDSEKHYDLQRQQQQQQQQQQQLPTSGRMSTDADKIIEIILILFLPVNYLY